MTLTTDIYNNKETCTLKKDKKTLFMLKKCINNNNDTEGYFIMCLEDRKNLFLLIQILMGVRGVILLM